MPKESFDRDFLIVRCPIDQIEMFVSSFADLSARFERSEMWQSVDA